MCPQCDQRRGPTTRLERQSESEDTQPLDAIVTSWDSTPSAKENTEAGNEIIGYAFPRSV